MSTNESNNGNEGQSRAGEAGANLIDVLEQGLNPKHECAVRGILGWTNKGIAAMCGRIRVGGRDCGYSGECEHQRKRSNKEFTGG